MIDSYSFGSIEVDGKKFKKDIIIFPDKIKPNWIRDKGHFLTEDDIKQIFEYKPEILIVGTGAYDLMKVDDKLKEKLNSSGINYIIKKTPEAIKEYNKLHKDKKTIFAAHLTC